MGSYIDLYKQSRQQQRSNNMCGVSDYMQVLAAPLSQSCWPALSAASPLTQLTRWSQQPWLVWGMSCWSKGSQKQLQA